MAGKTPEMVAFHVSDPWFDVWQNAWLDDGARARVIGDLALVERDATLGPLRYRLRHAQTNVHTGRYDLPGHRGVAPDLPQQLIAGDGDVVVLDYIPEESVLLAAARRWRGVRMTIAPHARAPVADCRVSEDAWLATRSKRARQRWRRIERALFDEMGMTFAVLDGRGVDLDMLMPELLAVEQSGWKGRAGSAIAQDTRARRFYTALAHKAAAAGCLRIAVLRHQNRVVAFEFGILGGDRLFLHKVGFDEAYEHQSIGHALAVLHIRHCCSDPAIAWYDKLGNGMTPATYKLRLADQIDTLYRITLYGPGWRAACVQAFDRARAEAKRLRDRWRKQAAEVAE